MIEVVYKWQWLALYYGLQFIEKIVQFVIYLIIEQNNELVLTLFSLVVYFFKTGNFLILFLLLIRTCYSKKSNLEKFFYIFLYVGLIIINIYFMSYVYKVEKNFEDANTEWNCNLFCQCVFLIPLLIAINIMTMISICIVY